MEFEGGLTAAFTMVAFTEEICKRRTSIHGSKVGLQAHLCQHFSTLMTVRGCNTYLFILSQGGTVL